MAHYNLALLGFGNVGRALARLLQRKEAELAEHYGLTYRVTGIATGHHGSAIDPAGIDLDRALQLVESGGSLGSLSVTPIIDMQDFIRQSTAEVLFENSPVNHQTGRPAVDHLRLALEMGMHAITANKGPVVHAYRELSHLAETKGRKFYFESTVMDGAPIFSLFRSALPGADLLSFRGILNSTTNLILTRMEAGESFDEAVRYTQAAGLAETDPSADIDGWDASIKVAALITVLMGLPFTPQQVDRTGIRGISSEMISKALTQGKRWKLVCSAEREGDNVWGKVAPELVSSVSPLYGVDGSSSIVEFHTDTLSSLSIVEGSPGPETTAYGLLADFINAVRGGEG
jgi:homoserine dehydrogenase